MKLPVNRVLFWLILLTIVSVFNLLKNLDFLNPSLLTVPKTQTSRESVLDENVFSRHAVGEVIEKAGYKISFSNPRYVFDEDTGRYKFETGVHMENVTFEPYIQTMANCDISEEDRLIRNGAGVGISELRDLSPGGKFDWVLTVNLEENQRVVACKYAPMGSYDPNLTVEVIFEED